MALRRQDLGRDGTDENREAWAALTALVRNADRARPVIDAAKAYAADEGTIEDGIDLMESAVRAYRDTRP
jgi:hypothetical protein